MANPLSWHKRVPLLVVLVGCVLPLLLGSQRTTFPGTRLNVPQSHNYIDIAWNIAKSSNARCEIQFSLFVKHSFFEQSTLKPRAKHG